MRPFEARVTYPAPPSEVAAMLADPAFVERKVAASRPVSSSVDVATGDGGAFTVTTVRALPTDNLPGAVQRIVGSTVEMKLVERWGAPAADGARSGTMELDVVGKPAKASGDISLVADGANGSVVTYAGSVDARIPLLGGRIEEQAARQVQRVLDIERSVGEVWLAER